MDTIQLVAPRMRGYIKISGLTGRTYTYDKAPWTGVPIPQVQATFERGMPKIKTGDEALYIASNSANGPADLNARLLYVGCDNSSRMFRGDSDLPAGTNFHHGNLRGGPRSTRLPDWLRAHGPIYIHRIDGRELLALVPPASRWAGIAGLKRTSRYHTGYWFEQAILIESRSRLPWNEGGAGEPALSTLTRLGFCPNASCSAPAM
jgi:hypothetical protein